ncbi:hypothetical protein P153DRAFT_87100 [Dothidotthia symphoricarpi CBS 119687]|uniref:Uncharacterized protein n=1 Tax=Dothidotthia symphoricarpi CBS 119687 TaxID=1392245 RepID=A0A6A6A4V1_9PLEO|nr:uncharacterized protein P153DRAFT_87100 [Dothidotthia symphoricarpi CBS 119687]KAF2126193.1 hypothetical protein P153DRAFT_87100 [Dothidotthia symphoricarpi CBS 119687]
MSTSVQTTPRSSFEFSKSTVTCSTTSIDSSTSNKTPGLARIFWDSIKRQAKEHHQSVNSAYATYYGQGYGQNRPQEWRTDRCKSSSE